MNQQELEALLAQIAPNNDPRRLVPGESTDTVEVPDPDNPSAGAKKKVPVTVLTWVDPGTGMTLKVQAHGDGTYTKISQGIDQKQQGDPATTPAQVAKDEQGVPAGSRQETDASGKTVKVTTYKRPDGTTYEIIDSAQAAPEKPTVAAGGPGRPAVQYVPDPDNPGQVKAVPIPGAPAPPPELVNLPSTQKWATRYDAATGKYITEPNPNYIKPSRIIADPNDPTKLINITEDDNGKPIVEAVTGQTAIKPADLPVLQAKYGQIAQGLGALAQDLNSRYARGEITEKQKNDAFTAAHQQAQTQVAEINSILETSKSIWSGELTQRAQSLGETQSRRSYAAGVLGNALDMGAGIARGAAGKGAGRDIVGGMAAILGIGQQYAAGMGGFRESPEIPLPAALQQARGISLPGYGDGAPSGPPGAAPGPPGVGAAPQISAAPTSPGGPPGASPGLPAPLLPPPPPVTGPVGAPPGVGDRGFYRPDMQGEAPGDPGFHRPDMQGMGAALQSGLGFGGSPVAAGGGGVYDPTQDVQGMIGDGADPAWAEAVRQAAAEVTQPGYAWQRFSQPASRFG